MKKNDNRNEWVTAPINGKDIVWDFIMEGLNNSTPVIENPINDECAAYASNGSVVFVKYFCGSLYVGGKDEVSVKEITSYILDIVNLDEGTDIFAEATVNHIPNNPGEYQKYIAPFRFWHTNP